MLVDRPARCLERCDPCWGRTPIGPHTGRSGVAYGTSPYCNVKAQEPVLINIKFGTDERPCAGTDEYKGSAVHYTNLDEK